MVSNIVKSENLDSDYYALGIKIFYFGDESYIGNGGSLFNCKSGMLSHLERGIGYVSLTNSVNGGTEYTERLFELIASNENWPGEFNF